MTSRPAPSPTTQPTHARRRIAVVTGTRAEYGLLRPVMHAIARHPSLHLQIAATGSHLLPPACSIDEIRSEFSDVFTFPMHTAESVGTRVNDVRALAAGMRGMADFLSQHTPDIVLVLGDRIEAFAAATAASVAGIRVAHMHGGDRAEGIADEAMRHAITKLAHIHLPATTNSALRIIAMGEEKERVHCVGSPAMDGLDQIPPLNDRDFAALGLPHIVVLLHPLGDDEQVEHDRAASLFAIVKSLAPALILHPNHDPGRAGIIRAINESGLQNIAHLPRDKFIGLLRRVRVIVGNSSAGLIECAAIPLRCVNVGRRQSGREMPANVVDVPDWDRARIRAAISDALAAAPLTAADCPHPYGDGRTGRRTADLLASIDLNLHSIIKRNAY